MREKYLYFRTEATDGDDDAAGDSACFPASSLTGMQPTNDDALTIPNNTHLVAMRAITEAISNPNGPTLIVVANDDSGGTEYLTGSGVTACSTISVAAAYTN